MVIKHRHGLMVNYLWSRDVVGQVTVKSIGWVSNGLACWWVIPEACALTQIAPALTLLLWVPLQSPPPSSSCDGGKRWNCSYLALHTLSCTYNHVRCMLFWSGCRYVPQSDLRHLRAVSPAFLMLLSLVAGKEGRRLGNAADDMFSVPGLPKLLFFIVRDAWLRRWYVL